MSSILLPFVRQHGASVGGSRRIETREMLGFILGTLAAQLTGSWLYWRVRAATSARPRSELTAATAAGLLAAAVASAIYLPLDVHTWIGGPGTSWGASVFLGICMGIIQGVLFRGRPFGPPDNRAA